MPHTQRYPIFNVTMYTSTFTALDLICRLRTSITMGNGRIKPVKVWIRRDVFLHMISFTKTYKNGVLFRIGKVHSRKYKIMK